MKWQLKERFLKLSILICSAKSVTERSPVPIIWTRTCGPIRRSGRTRAMFAGRRSRGAMNANDIGASTNMNLFRELRGNNNIMPRAVRIKNLTWIWTKFVSKLNFIWSLGSAKFESVGLYSPDNISVFDSLTRDKLDTQIILLQIKLKLSLGNNFSLYYHLRDIFFYRHFAHWINYVLYSLWIWFRKKWTVKTRF